MIDRIVGTNIANLRRQRGLTVGQLAALSAVNADNIAESELGKRRLTSGEVIDISAALNVTLDRLYQGAQGMEPIDMEIFSLGKRAPNS